ncbi:pentatricopeptide repeat-containing protein [Citrus sinensis]|uniref:Pentatricopeptide repeat-containing protein n=1 Tax=Citrus sinensis TaxID=2711 RepID=A0ACB8KDK1_CITSI|nr:pentatricopeptide repeat-containing protein [Citrus sinensis]
MSSHSQCQLSVFTNSTPTQTLHEHKHTLSQRAYIPSRIYRHPSALLLEVCTSLKELRRILPLIIKSGLCDQHLFQTKLVSLFCKYNSLSDAARVFEPIPDKLDALYHTMLKGYAKFSSLDDAVSFLIRMRYDDVAPVVYNYTYLLKVCGDVGEIRRGKEIHGQLIVNGFSLDLFAMTGVVNMYAKCGQIEEAYKMFDRMPERDLVSWNTIVAGFAQNGFAELALDLVTRMHEEGRRGDFITIVSILPAVANVGSLRIGKAVHGYAMRAGFDSIVNVSTALVDMYAKCGRVETSRLVFDGMKSRNVVSWNSMIAAYVEGGNPEEAMRIFQKMLDQGVEPTNVTIMEALHACADLGDLERGIFVHKFCFEKNVFVMTALIDMYAKCGAVGTARALFDMMNERHVTTWNVMIDGYGTHGLGKAAVELFNKMLEGPTKPNDITFLCAISACSHSGLVEEGIHYFTSLKKDYGIEPVMDHYGAMVDLLGRAGRLNEAWDFIQKMPIEPGITVFGAMLGACKIHKNVELGEKAANRLFELDPDEGGYHVLLANIYAAASMWDKLAKVRTIMEKKGLQKTPGCSLVELKNEVHSFYSGSTKHPQSKRIYTFLETLIDEIKAAGYVPDTNSIHDVEDYVQENLLSSHSEKLAIAFGLLNSSPGSTIHIRKNLRVCGDCHNATKYISLVTGCEIIVRDMHRFHCFKNGVCSCGDYW